MNNDIPKKKPSMCRKFVMCLVLGAQLSAASLIAQWNAAGWTIHDVVVIANAVFSGLAWWFFLRDEDRRSNGAG